MRHLGRERAGRASCWSAAAPGTPRLRCRGGWRGLVSGNTDGGVSRSAPARRRAGALASSPSRAGGGARPSRRVRVGTGTRRRQSGMASRCSSCTPSIATLLPRRTIRIEARARADGEAPGVVRAGSDWAGARREFRRHAPSLDWLFGGRMATESREPRGRASSVVRPRATATGRPVASQLLTTAGGPRVPRPV